VNRSITTEDHRDRGIGYRKRNEISPSSAKCRKSVRVSGRRREQSDRTMWRGAGARVISGRIKSGIPDDDVTLCNAA
jgi:hypothetical protein